MILGPPVWVTELAGGFWAEVAGTIPFPRDLRQVICWHDKLHCLDVPHLTLALALERFHKLQLPVNVDCPDRPLAGCFAGYGNLAAICYDSTLEPPELRFTIAHEVAHYLRDFLAPRKRASQKLGIRSLEVFDGKRRATENEQLSSIFRGITLECQKHFLERDFRGNTISDDAHDAEEAADWLAFELLAPHEDLVKSGYTTREQLTCVLISKYGFSLSQAAKYVTILLA